MQRRDFLVSASAASVFGRASLAAVPPQLEGVNIAGAEFGGSKIPGKINQDYIYPPLSLISTWASDRAKLIRVPFRWERVQAVPSTALRPTDIAALDAIVAHATAKGLTTVLDVHNYAKISIGGAPSVRLTGSTDPHAVLLANLWGQLAARYKGKLVWYGLMNEPNGISIDLWKPICQLCINAIRATGATEPILTPAVSWSAAHQFLSSGSAKLATLTDPLDNLIIEVHQYFNQNNDGTNGTCVVGSSRRIVAVTDWAKANGKRLFLGEFGFSAQPACKPEAKVVYNYLKENAAVWAGWTQWAAGPWWPAAYHFRLDPPTGAQRYNLLKALST